MKKRSFILMLILCLGWSLISPFFQPASVCAQSPVIRVGYIDYAGFIEPSEEDEYTGYGVELLERIAAITGWQIDMSMATGSRSLSKFARVSWI